MPTDFLGVAEVAKQLRCSRAFVYQMARSQKITVSLIGKKLLFTQEAIDIFIKSRTLTAKEK